MIQSSSSCTVGAICQSFLQCISMLIQTDQQEEGEESWRPSLCVAFSLNQCGVIKVQEVWLWHMDWHSLPCLSGGRYRDTQRREGSGCVCWRDNLINGVFLAWRWTGWGPVRHQGRGTEIARHSHSGHTSQWVSLPSETDSYLPFNIDSI